MKNQSGSQEKRAGPIRFSNGEITPEITAPQIKRPSGKTTYCQPGTRSRASTTYTAVVKAPGSKWNPTDCMSDGCDIPLSVPANAVCLKASGMLRVGCSDAAFISGLFVITHLPGC